MVSRWARPLGEPYRVDCGLRILVASCVVRPLLAYSRPPRSRGGFSGPADDQRSNRLNRSGSAAASQQEFPRIPKAPSKKLPTGLAPARFRAAILRLKPDGIAYSLGKLHHGAFMKLVTAIIKPFKLEDVRDALTKLGVAGLT